jgi:hypothetical protein
MTIKFEEMETLIDTIAPVTAALALQAVTSKHEKTDTFTGAEFGVEFEAEVERIADGFKAALNGEEDAVDAPEVTDIFAALGLGDVLAGLEG